MGLAELLEEHLPRTRLRVLLDTFPTLHIGVLGDFFLDAYFDCDPGLDEPSLETGKTCYQAIRLRRQPGAAGTVAANLVALGVGTVHAVGFCGDDGEGYELRRAMARIGLEQDGFFTCAERFTPTYGKPTYVEHRDGRIQVIQELERIDIKNRRRTPAALQDRLLKHLRASAARWDATIVLDQVGEADCGTVTTRVRRYVEHELAADPDRVVLADSRERIDRFRHVILKPNQREAAALHAGGRNRRRSGSGPDAAGGHTADDTADPLSLALSLSRRSRRPVFLTLGEAGMVAAHRDTAARIPAVQLASPLDPVGAGDTTSAATVAALAAGATVIQAGLLAVLAASVTVQQLGTTGTATPAQILRRHKEVTDDQ